MHLADVQGERLAPAFDLGTVGHEGGEALEVGVVVLPDRLHARCRWDIGAHRPAEVIVGSLHLGGQQPVQIELRRRGVPGLGENRRALTPRHERVVGGEHPCDLGTGGRESGDRRRAYREGLLLCTDRIAGVVGTALELDALIHQTRQPLPAVLLDVQLVEVEGRIVVVGVGRGNLPLPFRIGEILHAPWRGAAHRSGVVEVAEGVCGHCCPRTIGVFERVMDLVKSSRFVLEKLSLLFPAGEIVQRLEVHHVRNESVRRQLIVDPYVVEFAVVHDHGHRHFGKPLRPRLLDGRQHLLEVPAAVNGQPAALGPGSGVQLIQRLGLFTS
ncbi:hypothetical protein YWIDRAFT_06214 [Streptomyces sp. SceaMP-e96]|nr:hypothetical protein YWIDRAFT_06214 [Streptomyces sp. SceaMP-e96]